MKLACIVMAAGQARRFGSNKLMQDFGGSPLCSWALAAAWQDCFSKKIVVTAYDAVAALAEGFTVVRNDCPEQGVSRTIRLGLAAAAECDGALFLTADQPLLTGQTLRRLADGFRQDTTGIYAASCGGRRGSPVLFPRDCFDQLMRLEGNQGGASVIRLYPERLRLIEIPEAELLDCDTPQMLEQLRLRQNP